MIFQLLLIGILNLAWSNEITAFTVGTKKVQFYHYPEQRITVSKKCDQIPKGQFCDEIAFLPNLKTMTEKAKLGPNRGGMNPGSRVCSEVLKGLVLMGLDEKKNENSFCQLKNDLLIDTGTLTYYSMK
jgi:hypothetical protein